MDHLLSAAGVPATIVMRGGVKKGKDELRIPFLAKVREQVAGTCVRTDPARDSNASSRGCKHRHSERLLKR
jgi:hypothetical protein